MSEVTITQTEIDAIVQLPAAERRQRMVALSRDDYSAVCRAMNPDAYLPHKTNKRKRLPKSPKTAEEIALQRERWREYSRRHYELYRRDILLKHRVTRMEKMKREFDEREKVARLFNVPEDRVMDALRSDASLRREVQRAEFMRKVIALGLDPSKVCRRRGNPDYPAFK